MSTHYLIDAFTNSGSARVVDVRTTGLSMLALSVVNGTFVVRVPDGVQVNNPTTLNDVLTQKYPAILASTPGFTNITYDDMLDSTGVDLTYGSTGGTFGDRSTVSLFAGKGLRTQVAPLAGVVSQGVLVWEAFSMSDFDPSDDRMTRTYAELSPAAFSAQVSVDGGANYYPANYNEVTVIPPVGQGASLQLIFTNAFGDRVFLGSWAFIY